MNVKHATCGVLMLAGASIGVRNCSGEPTPEERVYQEKRDVIPEAAYFLHTISISRQTESLLLGPGALMPYVERGNYDGAIRALDQFTEDVEKLQSYAQQIAELRHALVEAKDAWEKAYPPRNAQETTSAQE